MGVKSPFPPTKGKKTKIRVALLETGDRTKPAAVTLTIGATGPAAAANTMTLASSQPTKIMPGQFLSFIAPTTQIQYLAQVRTKYESGTTLEVEPLLEAIPAAATAVFPCEFRLRTTANISFTYNVADVDTYDHTNSDAVPTSSTAEFTLDGLYSHYDPGSQTLAYAANERLEVYLEREIDIPSGAFAKGKVTGAAALVTSRNEDAPNDGFVNGSFSCRLVGDIDEALPVLAV